MVKEITENLGKEKILGVILNYYEDLPSKYPGYKKYARYYKKRA
jgi:hypothetical protein